MFVRCVAAYRGPMLFPKDLAVTEDIGTPGHHAVPVPREVNQGQITMYISVGAHYGLLFLYTAFCRDQKSQCFLKKARFLQIQYVYDPQELYQYLVVTSTYYILILFFFYFFSIAYEDPLYFYRDIPIANFFASPFLIAEFLYSQPY